MNCPSFSRILLCAALLLPSGFPDRAAAQSDHSPLSLETLRSQRKELAWRKRRIIVNNDGNELILSDFIKQNKVSKDAFLEMRSKGLVGSQVDTVFYCTSAGIGLLLHRPSDVDLMTVNARGQKTLVEAYHAAGLDPLAMVTEFFHKNSIEVFWSLRMNDTHDGDWGAYGPGFFEMNRFKKNNPGYLLGKPGDRGKIWSGVNYAVPEVRDYVFELLREVCLNYNIDGIELDFFRHAAFFKSTVEGKPATTEELEALNSLMERIRTMTEEVGLQRGRPILIGVKVPDSVPFCRGLGLDLERWLEKGWIDLLVTAGYYRLNRWEYSVALGHRHGVPVYPSLDDARTKDPEGDGLRTKSLLAYRARAAEAWGAGADGIYLFNVLSYFPSSHALYRELGDPAQFAQADKDYFASERGEQKPYGFAHPPFRDTEAIAIVLPTRPQSFNREPLSVPFPMYDDLQHDGASATLRLRFMESAAPEGLGLELNGQPLDLAQATREGLWLELPLPREAFRTGYQVLKLIPPPGVSEALKLGDLQIAIRYPLSK